MQSFQMIRNKAVLQDVFIKLKLVVMDAKMTRETMVKASCK